MSVTYTAITLVGCRISGSKMYRNEKERVCHAPNSTICKLDLSGVDYSSFIACPYCASSIWQKLENRLDNYNYELVVDAIKVDFVPQDYDNLDRDWWVGYIIGRNNNENSSQFSPVVDVKSIDNMITPILKKLKIWDSESYGLHTILTAM